MPINKNHEFEDLDGIKCSIVEKNATHERVQFLKELLEGNGYTVIVANSPPPKTAAPVAANAAVEETPLPLGGTGGGLFTIGVSDVTFNPTNAIFGRQLKTKDGRIVTLAYWEEQEKISNDSVPYYEKKS